MCQKTSKKIIKFKNVKNIEKDISIKKIYKSFLCLKSVGFFNLNE